MCYGIVESHAGFILPREPGVNLRLRPVDVLEWSTPAFRVSNAIPGQFVHRTRLFRNQSDKPVLEHPPEAIVRHDPDAEPRAAGMHDLQAYGGNLVRQIRELVAAPGSEINPTDGGVTVRIDHDAQSFESRGPKSASRTPGFRISSTPPRVSMNTGELGGWGHGTPFASAKPAITPLSVSPSTRSFRG